MKAENLADLKNSTDNVPTESGDLGGWWFLHI